MTRTAAFPRPAQGASENPFVKPSLLSARTITGDEVCNMREETLGDILDVMLETSEGKIRYVVLTSGGFLGMGDRLFAIARTALKYDSEHQ
ncbi:PRC-barrel domain-containing protein [Thioalkalivibrio sp.]|uniref:PRC-barrel domain-containing protein n=1 Tax=Thioalkalivibrio sp. TaxID=2093813 RepID=UPI0035626130